jgi:Cof subfamily protein (haloacid dehalogenase superfamily)
MARIRSSASSIRMIATDIDGTLLDSHQRLPDRNRDALTAAHEAGILVVLVTGRRFPFALPIAEQLPFDHVLITCNGAVIRSRSGVTHLRTLLPRATAAAAIAWTREWRPYTMLAYDEDIVETLTVGQVVIESLEKRTPQFMQWYNRVKQHARLARLEDALADANDSPLQVMFSGPIAPLREIEASLDAAPFRAQFQLTKTFYEGRDLGILDLLHPACSKGAALAAWSAMCGIARDEVMAVGDNHNDLDMLEFAGLPVVMGNSVPELRMDGWHVTGDNDSAGLAEAIERWALNG